MPQFLEVFIKSLASSWLAMILMTSIISRKYPYKLKTQLSTPKQSSFPERALMDVSDLTSMRVLSGKLKFHGKLETPSDWVTKYYKEKFIQALKEQVLYYGLQAFFTMPNADRMTKNLILNYHLF